MDIGRDAGECRERAAQCERMATVASDPTVRSMYAQLARQAYGKLARSARVNHGADVGTGASMRLR